MAETSYPFAVDSVTITVQLSELVVVAAYCNAKPRPTVLGCTDCATLCIERRRPCGCCTFAPSEYHFSSGAKRASNPGSHRMIPAAQLAEALALVRAA